MMLVDDRIGSRDLHGALERLGVPVDLTRLDSCDVAFVGRGLQDEPITIGVELKRVRGADANKADLLSSLRSGRFAGSQLGRMQDYDRAWLVTEGLWRTSEDGVVEVYGQGRWTPLQYGRSTLLMADLQAELLTVIIRGGLGYWHCPTPRDTVRFLATLYRWWTHKSLDEHRSHQAIYLPPPDRAVFVEPSVLCKMLSCLPGVGYEKAVAIEAHFGSLAAVWNATPQDLCAVDGIGTVMADRIYTTLHGAHAATTVTPRPRRKKERT